MKYLCMGYNDPTAWSTIPDDQRRQVESASREYRASLAKQGHLLEGRALTPNQATTLRFQRTGPTPVLVTDGPFAETKEQLGGVILLEADDLNHAIRLMSEMPCAKLSGSTIEIRPIHEDLQ